MEGLWQKGAKGGGPGLEGVSQGGKEDGEFRRAEFGEHLQAGTAGAGGLGAATNDRKRLETPVTGGHSGDQGVAFGAKRQPIGTVLHIAAGNDAVVRGHQGGAYGELGVRRITPGCCFSCGGQEPTR